MDKVDYFFKTIDGRKTVRKYNDYIPTEQEIKRIIESARLAPSAVNAQNWKFVAIYNQEIKDKMANEVESIYDEIIANLPDEKIHEQVLRYKGHSTFFKKAPVVIAIIQTPHPSFLEGVLESAGFKRDEIALMRPNSQLLSVGGAVENMSLAACALGLGSCWMVAPIIACKGFCDILKLKEGEKVVSLLTIGKPFEVNDNRSPKKSLNEVMEIIF